MPPSFPFLKEKRTSDAKASGWRPEGHSRGISGCSGSGPRLGGNPGLAHQTSPPACWGPCPPPGLRPAAPRVTCAPTCSDLGWPLSAGQRQHQGDRPEGQPCCCLGPLRGKCPVSTHRGRGTPGGNSGGSHGGPHPHVSAESSGPPSRVLLLRARGKASGPGASGRAREGRPSD